MSPPQGPLGPSPAPLPAGAPGPAGERAPTPSVPFPRRAPPGLELLLDAAALSLREALAGPRDTALLAGASLGLAAAAAWLLPAGGPGPLAAPLGGAVLGGALVIAAGDRSRTRRAGTVAAALATPGDVRLVLSGRALGGALLGAAVVGLAGLVAALAGGAPVPAPGVAAAVLVLALAGGAALGVLAAGLAALVRRPGPWLDRVEDLAFLAAGLGLVLAASPQAIAPLDRALPPAWALEAARLAGTGPAAALVASLAVAALLSAGALLLGLAAFGIAERSLRRRGLA